MSIGLQKQIKDNSTSVSDFFSDLYKWTEEKDYEEQRREKVRSGAPRPAPASKAEEPKFDEPTPAPIERDKLPMPQYYNNWESYDADAEAERHDDIELEAQRQERLARKAEKHRILDEMAFDGDGDRKRTTKARPMVKVSVKSSGRRASPVDLAAPKKAEANRLFAEGRYREAANMYSVAMEYLEKYLPPDERPEQPEGEDAGEAPEDLAGLETEAYELKTALLANRAAACVKMEEWRDAVEDCTEALRFDPSHHKALLRRGFAFAKTKRWLYASRDLARVVAADPSDKKANAELVMARRMLVDTAQASRSHAKAQMCDPTREQTMPLRRLVVRPRRAGEQPEASMAEAPQPQPTKAAAARGAQVLRELDSEEAGGAEPRAERAEKSQEPRKPYVPRSVRVRGMQSQASAGSRAPAAAGGGIGVAAHADAPAPAHMSFYAFEAAWTRARARPRERAALLRKVGPAALPALCHHSLDAELVASIVETLLAELGEGGVGAVQLAAGVLLALARTQRFELSMGGLSAAEWRACSGVLDFLDAAGSADAEEVRHIFGPFAPKPRVQPALRAADLDEELAPGRPEPLLEPAGTQVVGLEESLLDGCD